MSTENRLISAFKLVSVLAKKVRNGHIHYDDLMAAIADIPTVDAVEVVRCKDCKHWKRFEHLGCTDFVKVCGLANCMIGENGYCLCGERRSE